MIISAYHKVARLRAPGYPLGVPAPLLLNCPCGARPSAPEGEDLTLCSCGKTYNALGYLLDDAARRKE